MMGLLKHIQPACLSALCSPCCCDILWFKIVIQQSWWPYDGHLRSPCCLLVERLADNVAIIVCVGLLLRWRQMGVDPKTNFCRSCLWYALIRRLLLAASYRDPICLNVASIAWGAVSFEGKQAQRIWGPSLSPNAMLSLSATTDSRYAALQEQAQRSWCWISCI